jgi:ferritin-like protein
MDADARIAELEAERDREKKLHHQANAMRIQQMDRDSALIAALTEALMKVIGATRAYLPPDGISAKECISRILEATDNPEIIKVLSLPVTPAR